MKQLTFEFYNAEDDIEFMRTWQAYSTISMAAKGLGRQSGDLFKLARTYIDIPPYAKGMPYIKKFFDYYDEGANIETAANLVSVDFAIRSLSKEVSEVKAEALKLKNTLEKYEELEKEFA